MACDIRDCEQVTWIVYLFTYFWDMILLHNSEWPESHYAGQASLHLQKSPCMCCMSAGFTGVCHQAWTPYILYTQISGHFPVLWSLGKWVYTMYCQLPSSFSVTILGKNSLLLSFSSTEEMKMRRMLPVEQARKWHTNLAFTKRPFIFISLKWQMQ